MTKQTRQPRQPRQAKTTRPSRSERRNAIQAEKHEEHVEKHSPVQGKTTGQRRYLAALKANGTVVVVGPAGSGKTFIAASYASQMLVAGQIKQIKLVRPAVEAGEEKHGFLPGDINKKLAPWAEPVLAVLRKRLGEARVNAMILSGDIKVEPFTYMRGLSWDDAFVILDEAQNTTVPQMKLFTTRIGERCKVVIDGDVKQSDLHNRDIESGLSALTDIMADRIMEDTALVRLSNDDIVRSDTCKRWVDAWDAYEEVDTNESRIRRNDDRADAFEDDDDDDG